MSEPLGELELGSPTSSGSESAYTAQLGRISGKLLQANLVRNGIDLSFRNEANDPDLLYLNVTNDYIGINTDAPTVDLDVIGKTFVADRMDLTGTTATFGNVRFNSNGDVTSTVGPINIFTTGQNAQIEVGDILTDSFRVKDNYIQGLNADEDMVLFANSAGIVEIFSKTEVTGNVDISGNINAYSNVRLNGQLIIGDSPVDTVIINPDFKQSIIPGANNIYALGSPTKRWSDTWIAGTLISSVANIDQILITEQMRISGNTIDTIRSNDDLTITYKPGQGIVLENLRIDRTSAGAPNVLRRTIDNPNAFASDADIFGYAVDASASYFIVGAHQEDDAGGAESGKAYIFSVTTGSLLFTLDNPNPFGTSLADRFGYSVGVTESYAIVGAYLEDGSGTSSEGKAYIYSTATGGLLHTLNNPNPSSNDYFGWSVSISESYAIVGAYGESGFAGKAYIYDTVTGTLLHTLTNPNADPTSGADTFGISVSITDTHAIVGANSEDNGALTSTGKAYIFSSVTGSLLYTLNNPTPSTNDLFGWSVSVSDSYAAVGAYLDTFEGYTYIYDLSTGGLLHSLVAPPNNGVVAAQFGISVSITDDYTVVGAPRNSVVANSSGRAYIYDTATGVLLHTLENPNAFGTSINDYFGYSVAISDTCIVVGAYFEDDALPGNNSGKAYLFDSGSDTDTITNLSTTEPLTFFSTGNGYLKIADTNAMRIPFGTIAERPFAEIGETRWNSDLGYLECFDGSVYIISTGGGTLITPTVMEELGHVYTLIFG